MEKGMLDGLKANYAQDLWLESSRGLPKPEDLSLLYCAKSDIHIVQKGFNGVLGVCRLKLAQTSYNFHITLMYHYGHKHNLQRSHCNII